MTGPGRLGPRIFSLVSFVALLVCWVASHAMPRDRDQWVFGSLGGEAFHGNSKYLFLWVHEHTADVSPVWIGDADVVAEMSASGYDAYESHSLRGVWRVLRAGVICNSHGIDVPWWCTGGSTLVQLWHGNGIKQLGWGSREFERYSRFRRLFYRYIYWNWDYVIAAAEGDPVSRLCDAFAMDPKRILVTGYPRTDLLLDEPPKMWDDSIEHGRHDRQASTRTVVTYLPTYRAAYGKRQAEYSPTERLDFERLNTLLHGVDAELRIKLHPRESLDVSLKSFDRISIVPQRMDVMPLLAETDMLVTDYSSVYIDFLLLDRPIIFFSPDRDTYLDNQEMYFEYDAVTPGPVAESADAFVAALVTALHGTDSYAADRERVRSRFHDYRDSTSCRRVFAAIRRHVHDGGHTEVSESAPPLEQNTARDSTPETPQRSDS